MSEVQEKLSSMELQEKFQQSDRYLRFVVEENRYPPYQQQMQQEAAPRAPEKASKATPIDKKHQKGQQKQNPKPLDSERETYQHSDYEP